MKAIKLNLVVIVIGLIVFTSGCRKKVENEIPTVSFLQPKSNLKITKDTTISFIVEAVDRDGKIDRVEFTKNGQIVQVVKKPPFKVDYFFSMVNDRGTNIIKATAFDEDAAKGEAEIQIQTDENPSISFLQPRSNLKIAKDTLISFIVEAFDLDGKIDRVEFTKNGQIVQVVKKPPFKVDYFFSMVNDRGTNIIKATAFDEDDAKGEAEINIQTNENPSISFLQPSSNLIITKDTTITFIVKPFAPYGTIDSVVFKINGKVVQVVKNAPYKFNWATTEGNDFTYDNIVVATAYNNGARADAQIKVEIRPDFSKLVGFYSGISRRWWSSPFSSSNTNQKVLVHVYKSNLTPGLDFSITYNDTTIVTHKDLAFTCSGKHFSSSPFYSSSYSSLMISFNRDSLNYDSTQKCGIPCNSGIYFVIGRK
ncbi:MAG: Ig-like domain-containing protein [Saprospiraceae bacterium]